jgi:hypothetical protein
MIDIPELTSFLKRIKSKRFLEPDLTKLARDIIYKRTKSGFGVNQDDTIPGTQKRLRELSEKYKKVREKVVLGKFGKAKRSNLTLSGQMLDALSSKAEKGGITVFVKNTLRRPIKKKQGKAIKQQNTNAEIADFVSDQGRPFLNYTNQEIRQITFQWKRKVEKELNKTLSKL